ncbi:Predicted membrane protein [Soonwooa buanensis]|uniref:Predicted membrane protein n=1 Tax=Soonwooa buanensis TaxID=619805 RepID=A0A1T5F817_9FLAO|nr:DUF2306 domain-containing protein [Soonwooa buanensis]SKB92322.1 Predicted membrane protein [Soonwooa buanensis]
MKKTFFIIFAVLCVLIGLYPLIYFFIDRSFGLLRFKDQDTLQNLFWNIGFYTHIIFGGLSLLIGWIQFIPKWRNKNLSFHRKLGKLYIIFVFLSSLAGIGIATQATGGISTAIGFASLGIVWFLTTFLAFTSIKKRNLVMHQKMMIYSYAACFSAVTLRIYLPILQGIFQDFIIAYRIVAWLCWIPNIIFAYIITKNIKTSTLDVIK